MKRLLVLIFFIAISFLNAQTLEENADAAKLYNEGNSLRKAGSYNEAIAKYEEAAKHATDYRIFYQLGVTLKKQREFKKAEDALKKCLEANDKFAVGYNGLGGVYFSEGKYQEAVDAFKKFDELTEKNDQKAKAKQSIASAYTKLGINAKNDGKREKAVEFLTAAVEASNYDAAYLTLAEIQVELANYDKALEAADKAINYRKSIPKGAAYYFKGMAFKGKKENAKAIENFKTAMKDSKYKNLAKYELDLLK